jgi:hypothetical protein
MWCVSNCARITASESAFNLDLNMSAEEAGAVEEAKARCPRACSLKRGQRRMQSSRRSCRTRRPPPGWGKLDGGPAHATRGHTARIFFEINLQKIGLPRFQGDAQDLGRLRPCRTAAHAGDGCRGPRVRVAGRNLGRAQSGEREIGSGTPRCNPLCHEWSRRPAL